MAPRARARWLACAVGLALGVLLPAAPMLSCSSGREALGPAPASSSERARARAERKAREKALEEQGERVAASEPEPPPEPEPDEPPAPEPSATASVASDAGEPDAGAASDAGADAAADAAGASGEDVCAALCKRAVDCALAAFERGPGIPPELRRQMEETVRKEASRCIDKCKEEVAAKPERVADAKACIEEPKCEAFMTCIRDVVDER